MLVGNIGKKVFKLHIIIDMLMALVSNYRYPIKTICNWIHVIEHPHDCVIGIILNWFYSDHRKFRVIPAESFLRTFASDRSHMKKPNGEWIKTPPPYLPIRTPGTCVNWMMLVFSSWFLEMPVNLNWKHVHMFQYHHQDIHDMI